MYHAIMLALSVAAAGAGALLPAAAHAQPYPSRALRMIVPFPPGGPNDIIARVVAQRMGEALGQQIVVDNRGGAGGIIGTETAAKANPDGYTLLLSGTAALSINPSLQAKLPYDPVRDFTPLSLLATAPSILIVHPSLAAKSVKDLVALAKARPGQILYASAGIGTPPHLAGELFKGIAGVDMTHVPYKGGGQAINDVVGGQVKVAILGMAPVLQFLKTGQLKAIAVTGDKRTPLLPNVPTVSETLPGVSTLQWFGLVGPAGLPQDIVQKLHREVIAISQDPEVEQKVAAVALETRISTNPADLTRFMEQDLPKWPPLVKAAGLKRE